MINDTREVQQLKQIINDLQAEVDQIKNVICAVVADIQFTYSSNDDISLDDTKDFEELLSMYNLDDNTELKG